MSVALKRKRAGTAYLAAAVVLAGLASAVAAQALASAARTAPVAVARAEIPAYSRVAESQLEVRQIPAGAVPPDALRSAREAAGRWTRAAILPGEVVRAGHLAAAAGNTPLGVRLAERGDPGLRAFALPVIPGLGGSLPRAGDEVDVLAVLKSGEQPAAVTLLQGVPVLDALEGPVLVLLVTPQQAQDILAASAAGQVAVTVRPKGAEPAEIGPTFPPDILSRYGKAWAPAAQSQAPPASGGEVAPR